MHAHTIGGSLHDSPQQIAIEVHLACRSCTKWNVAAIREGADGEAFVNRAGASAVAAIGSNATVTIAALCGWFNAQCMVAGQRADKCKCTGRTDRDLESMVQALRMWVLIIGS